MDVIVVDDHEMIRDGLIRLLILERGYNVTASLGSAEALFVTLRDKQPDVIIMDLSMSGMGGVAAIRRVLLKWPAIKIIIFSIYQNKRLARHVLKLGASGYVTKNSKSQEVVAAITSCMEGEKYVSADLQLDAKDNGTDILATLSAKEFDIFCCISEGLSTKKISEKLFLSNKTIANNISIIKKKLQVSSVNEMIHLAIKEGLFITEY